MKTPDNRMRMDALARVVPKVASDPEYSRQQAIHRAFSIQKSDNLFEASRKSKLHVDYLATKLARGK
jgi:hypothetical protein